MANISTSPSGRDRYEIRLAGEGYFAETYDRHSSRLDTSIMVDGRAYFMAIGLKGGDVITNLVISISAAGTGMTLSKAGIYSYAASSPTTQLAASSDQGTSWQNAGLRTIPLSYTVPADGVYFIGLIGKGATLPTLVRSLSFTTANLGAIINSGVYAMADQSGLSDLPSPASTSQTAPLLYWVGVY